LRVAQRSAVGARGEGFDGRAAIDEEEGDAVRARAVVA
jgi:hypothetical protein